MTRYKFIMGVDPVTGDVTISYEPVDVEEIVSEARYFEAYGEVLKLIEGNQLVDEKK